MRCKLCPQSDEMSTGGEVANALVCKTSIRGFNSLPVLHKIRVQTAFVNKAGFSD